MTILRPELVTPETWEAVYGTIVEGFCPLRHPIDGSRTDQISLYLGTEVPRPHARLHPHLHDGLTVGRCLTCGYGWIASEHGPGQPYILRVDCKVAVGDR